MLRVRCSENEEGKMKVRTSALILTLGFLAAPLPGDAQRVG